MGAPSSLATLSTFLHYEVRYSPSASTIKDQGVESTPPIRMSNNFSSLTSYFRWKITMKTSSATGFLAPHIKVLLNTYNLDLQDPQP